MSDNERAFDGMPDPFSCNKMMLIKDLRQELCLWYAEHYETIRAALQQKPSVDVEELFNIIPELTMEDFGPRDGAISLLRYLQAQGHLNQFPEADEVAHKALLQSVKVVDDNQGCHVKIERLQGWNDAYDTFIREELGKMDEFNEWRQKRGQIK